MSLNYTPSVRIEFLVAGAANLTVGAWLLGTVGFLHHDTGHRSDPLRKVLQGLGRVSQGPGEDLLVLLPLIAFTYMVGLLAVNLTFFWPVGPIMRQARHVRLTELRAICRAQPLNLDRPPSPTLALVRGILVPNEDEAPVRNGLVRRFSAGLLRALARRSRRSIRLVVHWVLSTKRWYYWFVARPPETGNLGIALSLARSLAPAAVTTEYEYRRSIRQMLSGVLPAVLGATAVGLLTYWPHWKVYGSWYLLIEAVWLTAGLTSFVAVLVAIKYQEKVGQSLLLDTIALYYLKEAGGPQTSRHEVSMPAPLELPR